MKTKTGHKLKAPRTFKSNTRKVCCTLLVSCILFSSCGQDSSIENVFPTPKNTSAAIPDSAQNTETPYKTSTPEPISTDTPDPASDSVSPPEPTTAWIFIPENYHSKNGKYATDVSDIFQPEELDNAFSTIYNPNACPQLFARYHGNLNSQVYIIDIIQTDYYRTNNILRMRFYNAPYRHDNAELVQELCFLIEYGDFETIEDGLNVLDLNNDGYNDFNIALGIDAKNEIYLSFIYDTENKLYVYLGAFCYPTFFPEEHLIYETSYATGNNVASKYKIAGTSAILWESVHEIYVNDIGYVYTYQKYIDNELVTILDKVSEEEFRTLVDISEWPNMWWPNE